MTQTQQSRASSALFGELFPSHSVQPEETDMRTKAIFMVAAASLAIAGAAQGATKHHYRGQSDRYYSAYAAAAPGEDQGQGLGYQARCAAVNAQWRSEPGYMAIQDQDQANAIGGLKSTCH
jgi:hypothetical protein